MTREMEFRAWLKNENRMITNISSIKLDINCIYYDNNQMFSYERASFDEIELMQYTGLKDKNGVKIFEGDIFTWGSTLYQVIYADFGFKVKYVKSHNEAYLYDFQLNYFEENDEIEVIGNIYEDEDLLDVEEEI